MIFFLIFPDFKYFLSFCRKRNQAKTAHYENLEPLQGPCGRGVVILVRKAPHFGFGQALKLFFFFFTTYDPTLQLPKSKNSLFQKTHF